MKLSQIIENKQHIAIFGHTNIDGDCLGSMLSLGGILEQLGKDVDYIADPTHPSRQRLPWIEKISSDLDTSKSYDLRIGVDFSPRTRTGNIYKNNQSYFDGLRENILMIDHHIDDNYHATRNLKDANADANCVWLYELLCNTWRESYITPDIATYLLMGIMTDTGRFSFDNQSARILQAASKLITLWANKPFLVHQLYRNTDPSLLDTLQIVVANHTIQDDILFTYRDERDAGKISKTERDVIFNLLQGIAWYRIAVFATIVDDHHIKLSFRSKQTHEIEWTIIDCNQLAQTHFNGGGHTHAAGGIYRHNQKTNDALTSITQMILQYMQV